MLIPKHWDDLCRRRGFAWQRPGTLAVRLWTEDMCKVAPLYVLVGCAESS